MSKRAQVHLSSVVLAALIVLVTCYLLLIFYVPYLTAIWSEQHRALSVLERMVISIGQIVQSLGFPPLGLLVPLLIAALAWRLVAQAQWSRENGLTTGCR